jgi:methylated-DNA-[protein]-cysteine S-methyltransferase
MSLYRDSLSCPLGRLDVYVDSTGGLVRIDLCDTDAPPSQPAEAGRAGAERCRAAIAQLSEYFAGSRRDFDLPLRPHGTNFQQAAWQQLQRIPYGTTISYAEEAARLGRPTAYRAVGGANGRNPLPIVIPCHRVIAADGSLGGFSAGLARKQWLLDHERGQLQRRSRA